MPLDDAQFKTLAAAIVYSGGYSTVGEAVMRSFQLEDAVCKELNKRDDERIRKENR